MAKRESKPWGVWVKSTQTWLLDGPSRKSRFKLRRDAVKGADDLNYAWKGRKHDYEARKIP